jgi:hypothetical protein
MIEWFLNCLETNVPSKIWGGKLGLGLEKKLGFGMGEKNRGSKFLGGVLPAASNHSHSLSLLSQISLSPFLQISHISLSHQKILSQISLPLRYLDPASALSL